MGIRIQVATQVLVLAMFSLVLTAQRSTAQKFGPPPASFSDVKDVLFDFDTHESPADVAVLHADAQWLVAHPAVRFFVQGYSDPKGDVIYNLVLSQKRADVVRKTLIESGVSADRIVFATGWGMLYQICRDETEDCWHRNRRVTFVYAGQ